MKEQSLQSPPQLPPLHGQPHGLKDFSSPAADDLLRRSSSAGAHPVTPHQHELERQQLTPNRSGKHHQGRGHGHRSRHQTDSPTRLRSHDSATSTTDDAFGGIIFAFTGPLVQMFPRLLEHCFFSQGTCKETWRCLCEQCVHVQGSSGWCRSALRGRFLPPITGPWVPRGPNLTSRCALCCFHMICVCWRRYRMHMRCRSTCLLNHPVSETRHQLG